MRAWLAALTLAVSSLCQAQLVTVPIPGAPGLSVTVATGTAAQPLVQLANQPGAVNVTMADDDNRAVPLPFVFPYWGQQFGQSWMHSNGVVSFQNPNITGNFCCTGQNLAETQNSSLNYAIMPLWTDLIAVDGSHWYRGTANSMTYGWYGVNQFGTGNRSSFEVHIDQQGLVDMRLQGVMITASPVTIGMTGNLAQGEFVQHFYGSNFATQGLHIAALQGTTYVDPCLANPLSSPTCQGYAAAFLSQQCTITPLYDNSCPGYAQAYFTQQCTLNQLWDKSCPGYGAAYFEQQCSLDGLYDRKCPNFATAYATSQVLATNTSGTDSATTAVTNTAPTTVTSSTTTTTSSAPSASPADVNATVSLVPTASAVSGPTGVSAAIAATATAPATPATAPAQPQTRAQQLAQARVAAQRQALAGQGRAAQDAIKGATSLEQQQAAQDGVLAAMSFNPAFANYENWVLRDAKFYAPRVIYPNQTNVDNRRALSGLVGPSDRRHQQMIEAQYP